VRLYADSSALLKRVFDEKESRALTSALDSYNRAGSALVTSSLAWVEVSRAVRAFLPTAQVDGLVEIALSGVLEKPITAEVIALARRLSPPLLRSLDAVHLASALLIDADALLCYDQRMNDAAIANNVRVLSPTG
jgi:predicted nucleic acid-binding protein